MARQKPKLTGLEVVRPASAVDTFTNTAGIYPWSAVDASDSGIDLRTSLAALLVKHGHWVFLRRSTGRRCSCWNSATQEANPDCSFCTGEGWHYEDIKCLARKMFLTDPMTAAFLNKISPLGRVSVGDELFWLQYSEKPTVQDKIIEVSLDSQGEPIVAHRIEIMWEINWVQDYRDEYGRVEFWGCWVHNTGLTK